MDVLEIRLFGRVRVVHSYGPEVKMTHTMQTLLAYLLIRHAYCPRDVLACLCWCDQPDDRARSSLSTALWRLRNSLENGALPHDSYLLTTATGEVGFNWSSSHWLDLTVFEQEASRILALPQAAIGPAQVEALQNAISVYDGELLEGFYDDWALRERERVRSMYLDSLGRLMRYYHSHGAIEDSLATGHKILALDPLREDIYREMMRLYLQTGQRALAVRQYKICREVLTDELGISPMEETEALYHEIIQDTKESRTVTPSGANTLPQALHTLRQAMQQMDSARGQLHRAMQLIERFTGDSSESPPVRSR